MKTKPAANLLIEYSIGRYATSFNRHMTWAMYLTSLPKSEYEEYFGPTESAYAARPRYYAAHPSPVVPHVVEGSMDECVVSAELQVKLFEEFSGQMCVRRPLLNS